MNILRLSNMNFQASIEGKDFGKIRNMSITNGLTEDEAIKAENKIHEAFPARTDKLKISSIYNPENANTTLSITLLKPEFARNWKKWNGCYRPVLKKDYTFETQTDEQVKNLFLNLVDLIVKMKDKYLNNQRNNYI